MSGTTDAPKLHFEVRKDSAPVDPVDLSRIAQALELARSGGPRCRSAGFWRSSRLDQSFSCLPSRPARSCMNCQATRPERLPRVVAHSSASARSVSGSIASS